MATLSTIDGTQAQGIAIKDALCNNFNYNLNKQGAETEKEFSDRMIGNWLINQVKRSRLKEALPDEAQVYSDADAEMVGITVT